jgi:aspartokinase
MLDELEQLLKGIAMMKEMTLRTRDYLVSFGECMSTRIFAAYLNKLGVKARQVLLQFKFLYVYSEYVLCRLRFKNASLYRSAIVFLPCDEIS